MASKRPSLGEVLEELKALSFKLDLVQSYIQSKFGIDFTLYIRQKEKEQNNVQLPSRPDARTRYSERVHEQGPTYTEMATDFVEENADVCEDEIIRHLSIKHERSFGLEEEEPDEEFGEEAEGPCIYPGGDGQDPLFIPGLRRNSEYLVESGDSGTSGDSVDGRKRKRKWLLGSNIAHSQHKDPSRRYPPNSGSSEDLSLLPNGKRLCLTEIETETEGLLVWPSSTQTSYSIGYQGYIYVYHATGPDKQGLRCVQSNDPKRKCKGRLHLSLDYKRVINEEFGGPDRHNHPPRLGKAEALRAMWRIKKRLINNNDLDDKSRNSLLKTVVDEETAHLDENGKKHLPTWDSLKRNLQRARKRIKDRTMEANKTTTINQSQGNLLLPPPASTSEALEGSGRSGSGNGAPLSLLGHMVGSAEDYARSFEHL